MSHIHDLDADHRSVYDGLVGSDVSQWAFGTDFEDPLAGVDTTIPSGIDADALAEYCLMLGDDALVYAHRLSEWTSNAPDLEDDIALANIALDLLGQARLLLARAAAAAPQLVPALPAGSPVPAEDAFAFFRGAEAFRNLRFVEPDNGDFAMTIARLFIFASYRLALLQGLVAHRDAVLSAIAAKGVTEVSYHRDYAARWFVTLAHGTDESRRRLVAGLEAVWPFYAELFRAHPIEIAVGVDPSTLRAEVDAVLDQVLAVAEIDRPSGAPIGTVNGGMGRDGRHTEALSLLLAEMQVVARAHPMGQW
jgi:ring-1,2-phenylacetyl-CoA epoxidase subunit PaaC